MIFTWCKLLQRIEMWKLPQITFWVSLTLVSKSEKTKTKKDNFRLSLVINSKAKQLNEDYQQNSAVYLKSNIPSLSFPQECIADMLKINQLGDCLQ